MQLIGFFGRTNCCPWKPSNAALSARAAQLCTSTKCIITTIIRVATDLQDKDWLRDVASEMEIEDGVHLRPWLPEEKLSRPSTRQLAGQREIHRGDARKS